MTDTVTDKVTDKGPDTVPDKVPDTVFEPEALEGELADRPPVHEDVDGADLPEEQGVDQPTQGVPEPPTEGARLTPAGRLLQLAAKEIGTLESPRGSNRVKYWTVKPEWNGSAWCAAFIRWCLVQGGVKNYPPITNPYYVPFVEQWGRTNGKFITRNPSPGDLVIFGKSDIAAHIGFVEKPLADGWVQTIEGNTSSGTTGSQNNGDGVYRRKRGPSWIRGYVKVDYAALTTVGSGGAGASTVSGAATVTTKSGTVAPLTVDGRMGPASRKAFQQLCGLTGSQVNGKLSPSFWKAAQRWAGLSGADIDGSCGPRTRDAIARKTGHTELLGAKWAWVSDKPSAHTREIQAAFNRAIHEGWRPS